jgi:hypothetical protein
MPVLWTALRRYDAVRDYHAAVTALLSALGLSASALPSSYIPVAPTGGDAAEAKSGSKSTQVFISYKSTDRPAVSDVASRLIESGYRVWYDQRLLGGQIWWDEILQNIRSADVFLFALTSASLNSKPCQVEYSYADALQKRIVPLLLVDSVNMQLLPPQLQQIQVVDYRSPGTTGWPNLIQTLASLPSAAPFPSPLPSPPPVPMSALGALKLRIDGEQSLSRQDQQDILYELKLLSRRDDTSSSARELLSSLLYRHDLLYLIGKDVEQVLSI